MWNFEKRKERATCTAAPECIESTHIHAHINSTLCFPSLLVFRLPDIPVHLSEYRKVAGTQHYVSFLVFCLCRNVTRKIDILTASYAERQGGRNSRIPSRSSRTRRWMHHCSHNFDEIKSQASSEEDCCKMYPNSIQHASEGQARIQPEKIGMDLISLGLVQQKSFMT